MLIYAALCSFIHFRKVTPLPRTGTLRGGSARAASALPASSGQHVPRTAAAQSWLKSSAAHLANPSNPDGSGRLTGRMPPAKSPMFTRHRTGGRLGRVLYPPSITCLLGGLDTFSQFAHSKLSAALFTFAPRFKLMARDIELLSSPCGRMSRQSLTYLGAQSLDVKLAPRKDAISGVLEGPIAWQLHTTLLSSGRGKRGPPWRSASARRE
jgi:hypothetical protein